MVDSSNAEIQRKECVSSLIAKAFYSLFALKLLISAFFLYGDYTIYIKLTRHNTNITQTPGINSVKYPPRNARMIICLHEHHHKNRTQEMNLAFNLEKIFFPSQRKFVNSWLYFSLTYV